MIDELLKFNEAFVAEKGYEKYITTKYPDKKIAIVTCMDTRLVELLPAALGLKNGDVKLIKNAGGTVMHPFGSVVRSLLVAIYELGVQEIMIIGHTDCGVQHMDSELMLKHMRERGVSQDHLDMMEYCDINLRSWLSGFNDTEEAVRKSVGSAGFDCPRFHHGFGDRATDGTDEYRLIPICLVTSLLVGLEKRTFVFIQTNVRSDENVRTFRLERADVFLKGIH